MMVKEYSDIMKDIEAQESRDKSFKELMLGKIGKPYSGSKAQLPHGKFSPHVSKQLYGATREQTKKSWEAHIKELMGH